MSEDKPLITFQPVPVRPRTTAGPLRTRARARSLRLLRFAAKSTKSTHPPGGVLLAYARARAR